MMTKSERQSHIDRWEKSGQNKKAYAESAGIKYATFIYWFRERPKKVKKAGRFIKLSKEQKMCGVEVKLPNGIQLYVKEPLSIELLKLLSDV